MNKLKSSLIVFIDDLYHESFIIFNLLTKSSPTKMNTFR